ncbi:unnamed protein product [Linum trigynum]|uniref:Uncharacterized protein n=1 Tax=Linum trigynum TaxID=586398 RepID=A0AAV2E6K6_9ROSI
MQLFVVGGAFSLVESVGINSTSAHPASCLLNQSRLAVKPLPRTITRSSMVGRAPTYISSASAFDESGAVAHLLRIRHNHALPSKTGSPSSCSGLAIEGDPPFLCLL